MSACRRWSPCSTANGTAYARRTAAGKTVQTAPETRFVLWFNGNGIPERYWIPSETGADFDMTPCLSPLAPFRNDIHVLSGLDNPAAACRDRATITTIR